MKSLIKSIKEHNFNPLFLNKIYLKKIISHFRLNNRIKKVKKNPNNIENYKLPTSFITSIDLEPIAACNLRCNFCQVPGWERAKATNAIDLKLFENILEQLTGLISVKLQGMGEPFINPKLPEMIKICSNRNLQTSITSNGTLLNQKKSEAILEAGLSNLVFSIDGAKKETYEKAREGADYFKVMNNIKDLTNIRDAKNYKTKIRIDCLASNQEIFEEIPELVKLSSELGVESLHVKARLKVWEKNKISSKNEEHFTVEKNIYLDEMNNYSKITQSAKKIANDKNIKLTMGSMEDDRYSYDNQCMWPWSSMFIGTEGKVVPCCVVGVPETWSMGDLAVKSIEEIWNSKEYIDLRQNLITGKIPTTCKPCYGS